ncbi:hypothetical protein ACFLYQ_01465 [Chloroflexota bacterium]
MKQTYLSALISMAILISITGCGGADKQGTPESEISSQETVITQEERVQEEGETIAPEEESEEEEKTVVTEDQKEKDDLDGDVADVPGVVRSSWALSKPEIDGVISSGEWADSSSVNLLVLSRPDREEHKEIDNYIETYIMNDSEYIYIALDFHENPESESLGGNIVISFLREGEGEGFRVGWQVGNSLKETMTEHINIKNHQYSPHCTPFEHKGLSGIAEYAGPQETPTQKTAGVFEVRIPLALIQSSPGSTIDFSLYTEDFGRQGVFDAGWPILPFSSENIDDFYGSLVLATR